MWEEAYPKHTLVSEAVNACKANKKLFYAKGLVNAVLRRVIDSPTLIDEVIEDQFPPYPSWWVRKLDEAYSHKSKDIIRASQYLAPMTLRFNQQMLSLQEKEKYLEELSVAGIEVKPITQVNAVVIRSAYRLTAPRPVEQIPGFLDGRCSVQDASAQLPPVLLRDLTGKRVLDACAAPGGKAAHLLETMELSLDALELDPLRAEKIRENLERLNLKARVLVGDASLDNWWDGQLYDAIIADVPCSASGIVRRHPDIPYLRREEDIARLQKIQRQILQSLWNKLKPGGELLYVTCSVFPEEGEDQAIWWLNKTNDAVRLQAPGQILPGEAHDGFFYALFEKAK